MVLPIENAAMSTYFLPMASGPIAFLHVRTPDYANLSQFLQSCLNAIILTKISSSIRKPSEAFLKATNILKVPNLVLQVCPHLRHSKSKKPDLVRSKMKNFSPFQLPLFSYMKNRANAFSLAHLTDIHLTLKDPPSPC